MQGISRTTVANCRQSVRSRLTGTVTGPVGATGRSDIAESRRKLAWPPLVHPRSNFVKRTRPEKTKKKIPGKCALSLLQKCDRPLALARVRFAPKSDKSLGRSEMTRWAQQQTHEQRYYGLIPNRRPRRKADSLNSDCWLPSYLRHPYADLWRRDW